MYLEIYYHKIVLATARDLEKEIPKEPALARLKAIRDALCCMPSTSGLAPLAWDVLLTERDILQRAVRDQYLDLEDAFSVASYLHTFSIASPMLKEFSDSPIMINSRVHAPDVMAAVMMLDAEISSENGQIQEATIVASIAQALYLELEIPDAPPHAGLLDWMIFKVQVAGRSISLHIVKDLYDQLRKRNDIARMRRLRKCHVSYDSKNTPAYNWALFQ